MILLDCGNSHLKAQWHKAGQLQASYSCCYNRDWAQCLGRWLQDLPAKHCYFASVLDATREARLEQCLKQKFGTAVTRFVSMPQALGVTNAYREPERLGVDRWMALIAASKLVIAINERTTNMKGRQVATVGKIQAFPGAPNVIPGKVELSLEVRDLDAGKIQQVYEVVQQEAKAIEKATGVNITFEPSNVNMHPAPTHMALRSLIEQSANDLGLSYQHMPSGAGHDAQDMAPITPTGMIFVPSRGGISHSPKEYTSPQDMANGANVLVRTLLKLDETHFGSD